MPLKYAYVVLTKWPQMSCMQVWMWITCDLARIYYWGTRLNVMSYRSQQCMLITKLSRSILDPFFSPLFEIPSCLVKGGVNKFFCSRRRSSCRRCPSSDPWKTCMTASQGKSDVPPFKWPEATLQHDLTPELSSTIFFILQQPTSRGSYHEVAMAFSNERDNFEKAPGRP